MRFMKERMINIRASYKDCVLFHRHLSKDSRKIIKESKEAHEYVKEFCSQNATHFMDRMDEIGRDFAIFNYRAKRIDFLFSLITETTKELNKIYARKKKDEDMFDHLVQKWIDRFYHYSEQRKDLEQWLNNSIQKWAFFENELIKHCD